MKIKAYVLIQTFITILVWGAALIGGSTISSLIIGETAGQNIGASLSANAILYLFVCAVLLLLYNFLKIDSLQECIKIINIKISRYALLAITICFAADIFLCVKYVLTLIDYGYLDYSNLKFSGPFALLSAILVYAAVGFSEELFCRGFLLGLWLKHYSEDKRPMMKAAVISSLLFGLVHLINLTNGFHAANLIYTLIQIIFAGMYGMFFSALMFQSNSLWLCAIIHGMIDFIGNIYELFVPVIYMDSVPDSALTGFSVFEGTLTLLAIIPGFIWAVRSIQVLDNAKMEISDETYPKAREKSRT